MSVVAMALCALGAGLLGTAAPSGRHGADRLATALALGLALFLWLPYLTSRAWGIEQGVWIAFGILAVFAAGGVVRTVVGRGLRTAPLPSGSSVCLLLITGVLVFFLYAVNLRVRDGGFWSADAGCEDMGFHATLANAFLHSHERILRPTYPIFPSWPLGYPFLADFSASTAMALGAPIGFGLFATAVFALLALLANLYALARRWLAPPYAVLAIGLFLLGGNLGFVLFLRDLPAHGLSAVWLADYTNDFGRSLHWGNVVTAVLLPMRTSLFGAPIAIAAVAILSRESRPTRADAIVAGVLLGALPLVNAHSFLAASLCAAVYVLRDLVGQTRRWWPAMVVAAVLAGPQLLWVRQQTAASATPFIRSASGFLFDTPLGWPAYWLLNGGLFAPLGLGAWIFAGRELRRATLPLLLLLPLCMAVSFQPNPFDNIKLLLFFHVGCALLVADFCRRSIAAGWARALAAGVAVVVCTASGVLSWVREPNVPCVMATAADRAFAARVLASTDERSLILTAQKFNHPVPFLTGRSIVLGFHNWLSQHGIPFQERAADVKDIYAGAATAPALLAKYGVTDVVVGPAERVEFPDLNEAFLARMARAQTTDGEYTLYQLAR